MRYAIRTELWKISSKNTCMDVPDLDCYIVGHVESMLLDHNSRIHQAKILVWTCLTWIVIVDTTSTVCR
jgi:hypothetical protein